MAKKGTNAHDKEKYSTQDSKVLRRKLTNLKRKFKDLQKRYPENTYEIIESMNKKNQKITNIVMTKGRHPHKISKKTKV